MSLSRLLSGLFTGSEPSTESPATTQEGGETATESEPSPTVIHECRTCGTNVTAETDRCPACDDDDIVRYSID